MKQVAEEEPADAKQPSNGDTLKPTLAVKALQAIDVPEQLIGTETGRMKLSFDPGLKYVQVQFKVDNQDIKIDRDEDIGEDGNFEFHFPDDPCEQVFNIWAIIVEKERDESIYISCFDQDGKSFGKTQRRRIKFTVPPPEPGPPEPPKHFLVQLLLYLWFLCKKWYVRYPVLLVTVLLIVVVVVFRPDKIIADKLEKPWKALQIVYLGKPPDRLVSPGIDPLKGTPDGKPDPALWNVPPEWRFDANPPTITTVGENVGALRVPELSALYDYKVLLKIVITSDDQRSATWLLRVQENKQDYYLFRLTFPTPNSNHAQLEGFLYEHGKQRRPLIVDSAGSFDYFPFHRGNLLWINIEVKENVFEHKLYLTKVPKNEANSQYANRERSPRTFSDSAPAHYEYGSLGFKGEDASQIKVVGLSIYDIK